MGGPLHPLRQAERRAAIDDFIDCMNLALETYKTNGALLALTLGNKHFEGRSALDLIACGEVHRVREWLLSLTGMVAT